LVERGECREFLNHESNITGGGGHCNPPCATLPTVTRTLEYNNPEAIRAPLL
jgi:hypothetical protein